MAATLLGCGSDPVYPTDALRIATGGRGGVYFAYGTGLADLVRTHIPQLRPEVLVTAASVENLRGVAGGEAEVGFALADAAALAYAGLPPFAAALPIAALARLYDNYLHVVVCSDLEVKSVSGLRGMAVSVGAPGSGTELTAHRVLDLAGIDVDVDIRASHLGVDESAAALLSGTIDAFFFSGGLPTAAVATLAHSTPIRLLDLGSTVPALRERHGQTYVERTIPASAYGVGVPVATVGVPNYLIVSAGMADRLAYDLVRIMFENRGTLATAHPEGRRLDRVSAINTFPVPLHNGAQQYYREAKR
jgi:TRAP transporter TAXI family solute receptor